MSTETGGKYQPLLSSCLYFVLVTVCSVAWFWLARCGWSYCTNL